MTHLNPSYSISTHDTGVNKGLSVYKGEENTAIPFFSL